MFITDLAQSAAAERSAEIAQRRTVLRAQADRRADIEPTMAIVRRRSVAHPFRRPVLTPHAR
jgi:hypothetical protein